MLRILDINAFCTGCGACASICPKAALTIEYNDEGFYYPRLNQDLCIECKSCEKVCHVLNLEIPEQPSRHYSAYMCKSNDKELLNKSSSGGIFSTLAAYVLKAGGLVYGARYNFEIERLEHCSTDNCTIDELRKSKYIESYTGSIFKAVADNLKKGRMVLFCGTPCQIAGLSSYLQQRKISIENLIRVRFVCHGVPSNKFFTEYKNFEEKRYGAKMIKFDFRPKMKGLTGSNWLMEFANGKSNIGKYMKFYYYYYYGYYYSESNYLLRESCYQCGHLRHENADFTISDFSGVIYYKPDYKIQDGLSLVLTHTPKAEELMTIVNATCEVDPLPLSATDYIYKDASKKTKLLGGRRTIMQDVMKNGYMRVVKKTLRKEIVKRKIKSFLSEVKHSKLGI